MKINRFFILAATTLALGLTSCSLDVDDVTETSTDNFPATEDDATAVLAGVYQILNAQNASPQETFLYYAMLASDDQYGGGGTNDKLMQAMDMILNNGTDMTIDFYNYHYQGINRANTLIQALPSLDFDDDTKAQYMGEALFMRAFYYYELASMYGNVPLLTEPSGDLVEPGDVNVLWGQILQDLYEASTTMPAQTNHDGHVDKYCAEAMLGRAWLFYTGFYCNGSSISALTSTTYSPLTSVELPNGDTLTKSQVIACIDDCVNNSGYSLVDNYQTLWPYTNSLTVEDYGYTAGQGLVWCQDGENGAWDSNDTEIMFSTKFNSKASWNTTIGYGNGYALHFGPRGGMDYRATFPFGQGWGAGPVAPNLVNDWKAAEPNDIRLEATVQDVDELPDYVGDDVDVSGYAYEYGGASWLDYVQETGYYGKKIGPVTCRDANNSSGFDMIAYSLYGLTSSDWENGSGEGNFQTQNLNDLVHIRFADVLLMQSELKEDATGLNKVRARAGLSSVSYSLTAIQNERRWEFATEGIRWNDLRRWHIAATALAKQENQAIYVAGEATTNTAHNGGYASRYNATAGFQKIPESQVSLGYISQNEGWTGSEAEYAGW